jgi:hypothetical protein
LIGAGELLITDDGGTFPCSYTTLAATSFCWDSTATVDKEDEDVATGTPVREVAFDSLSFFGGCESLIVSVAVFVLETSAAITIGACADAGAVIVCLRARLPPGTVFTERATGSSDWYQEGGEAAVAEIVPTVALLLASADFAAIGAETLVGLSDAAIFD